jgi:hypothetical protein
LNGERHDAREFLVQPIIHSDDKVNGGTPIAEFVETYNRNVSPKEEIAAFAFDGGEPLFIYEKGNLTYGMLDGLARNPAEYLTDQRREFPEVVLEKFLADLRSFPGKGRWTLVGYNVRYDYQVLMYWIERVLGLDAARDVTNMFSYSLLDAYALVQWFGYAHKLKTKNKKLSTVASALGFADFAAHTAKADIEETYYVAKILMEYLGEVPTEET